MSERLRLKGSRSWPSPVRSADFKARNTSGRTACDPHFHSSMAQEPPFTIYTDKTKACHDYVWYSSENLNANTALQVRRTQPRSAADSEHITQLMSWLCDVPILHAVECSLLACDDARPHHEACFPIHALLADHLTSFAMWRMHRAEFVGLNPGVYPCSCRTRHT